MVPVNLITPTITTQLIPTGAPLISLAIPPHVLADPASRYGYELTEYLEYHITGSTVFWAEGLPLDASPPKFAELLRHLEDGLQLPIDHARTLQHIQRNIQQGTPTTRLPFGFFGTCIFMGPDAAHYTYGFHHGQRSRLALRIIPISYVRTYAATGSRQSGTITSYVSIHPTSCDY